MVDVTQLDPAKIAPNVVVDRDANRDVVGHGRYLPLIGNSRPHVYDVMFDHGRKRVYADNATMALAAIIPDYEHAALASYEAQEGLENLMLSGQEPSDEQREKATELYGDAWACRHLHARETRIALQQAENERARADGDWESLSSAEQGELEDGAAGMLPFGIPTLMPIATGDIFGGPDYTLIEQGVWETAHAKLVLNRGDYDLFSEDGVPEPESTLPTTLTDEDGTERQVIIPDLPPKNLIILDPSDDVTYLASLHDAGVVEVTIRATDLPDRIYTDAVALGRELIAKDPSLGDAGTGLGFGITGHNLHAGETPEHVHEHDDDITIDAGQET